MKIFKVIEVDMVAARARIEWPGRYSRRQVRSLRKLYKAFEAGEWQRCLDLIGDRKTFPYNKREHYNEREHIGIEISEVLQDAAHYELFTRDELLRQAKEKLTREKELVS